MFTLFAKGDNRISIDGENIFIENKNKNVGKAIEINSVFKLSQEQPELKIFENNILTRIFKIETLINNPNLTNQFLHSSIRILPNSAVMIDGIISACKNTHPLWTDKDYEAIRLQPFYLSNANSYNQQLIGKGLFERGLHFSGTITPTTVRCICICGECNQSFTIQHFHAGFSEVQYFYSSDSKETLIVPYGSIDSMPVQLQEIINNNDVESMEEKLPIPSSRNGFFKYYNSFKCPHCLASYIDFESNKEIRPTEYYGNTYINEKPIQWNS